MINGVRRFVVNPAYNSPVSHLCGDFGVRRGDRFYCATRGERNADLNTALGYFARMGDPKITLSTPYRKAKKILQGGLRLFNQDSRNSAVSAAGHSESESIRAMCEHV